MVINPSDKVLATLRLWSRDLRNGRCNIIPAKSPGLRTSRLFKKSVLNLPPSRRQVRAAAMRHLSRHADAFAQRGVRVNRLADVYCICTHYNGQRKLANHVASVSADHAADGKDCGTLVRIWLPLAITASN